MMTARLEVQQLDQVWDASVLGKPFPIPVKDQAELIQFRSISGAVRAEALRPCEILSNPARIQRQQRDWL